jgi:cobaltochelatase CobS
MATQIETLEAIINDPTSSDVNKELARKNLERLQAVGSAQIQTAAMTGEGDAELMAVLNALQAAMKGGGGNVSMADLRKAVNEELAKRKITLNDLSPQLLGTLNSTRAVSFTVRKLFGIQSTQKGNFGKTLARPLTQLILSDILARNNTYLYGGAGTGKTYLAEEISKMLGWKPITLNCNQFTSPLDILGGQTTDGYQEGKLSIAWCNYEILPTGEKKEYPGCVLILDELPKIDPNTAGILNQALAKVKDYDYNDTTGMRDIPPTIMNGKNEVLSLGNLFVIATGNVALNTIDPDYEANFKQDLSLQDRFIGSTYKVYVDYEFEATSIMEGFAFIWLFLVKVREAIETNRGSGQAFVSIRLMTNVKETYIAYREVEASTAKNMGKLGANAITNPKTIVESMENFFGLFKVATKEAILNEVDFNQFKRTVEEKNAMPYDPAKPNFDTAQELQVVQKVIADYKAKQKTI